MPVDFLIEITIARPRDEVFAYVADPGRLHEWQTNVVEAEVLGGGALRAGSRVREVREVRGRRMEQVVRIEAFDPPRGFEMKIVEGALPIDGELALDDLDGSATRVRLHAHGRLSGPTRLATPLLAIGLKREFAKQYRLLKERLEAARGERTVAFQRG